MHSSVQKHGDQAPQSLASTSEAYSNAESDLRKTDAKWPLDVNEDVTLLLDSAKLHVRGK